MLVLNTNEQPHNYLLSNGSLVTYPDFHSILWYMNVGKSLDFRATWSSRTPVEYWVDWTAGSIWWTPIDSYLWNIEQLRTNVWNLNDGSAIWHNDSIGLILNASPWSNQPYMKATKKRRFAINWYLESWDIIGEHITRNPIIYIWKNEFINANWNVVTNFKWTVRIWLLHKNWVIDYITNAESFIEYSRTHPAYWNTSYYMYINSVSILNIETNGLTSNDWDIVIIDLTLSAEYNMLWWNGNYGARDIMFFKIFSWYFWDSIDNKEIKYSEWNSSSFSPTVSRFKPRPIQISIK